MLTILITGAAGTLGQLLHAHLAQADDITLRLLDRKQSDGPVETFDLTDAAAGWSPLLAGADAVIHLAANPDPRAGWADLAGPNIDAVLNLYRAAAQQRVPHVILASSIWATAGRRHDGGPIDAMVRDPGDNPYGTTKLLAERIAHAHWRSDGIATTILRIGAYSPTGSTGGLRKGWDLEARLSPHDLCAGMDRSIRAPAQGVRTLNLISRNDHARFTLDEAEATIGYVPRDHFAAPPATAPLRRLLARLRRR
jgi:uronate dehydrogenase